jgi:hypothetical protein
MKQGPDRYTKRYLVAAAVAVHANVKTQENKEDEATRLACQKRRTSAFYVAVVVVKDKKKETGRSLSPHDMQKHLNLSLPLNRK